MFRKLLLSAIVIVIGHTLSAQSPTFNLIFQDNFKGEEIDTASWSKIPRGRSDWNRHMSSDSSLYKVENDMLTLYGRVNEDSTLNDTAPYITGGVYTKGKKMIVYGKVEVSAKFKDAQGTWPAIWMLPMDERWPYGGEIDIMEHLNYDTFIYQTIHTNYTYNLGQKENPPSHGVAPINPGEFNVYGVELLPDKIVFYVNGVETFMYPKIEGLQDELQYPFGEAPFYLLIDMQIGGGWVGQPNPEDYPSWMEIDWIKMYELVE